jgi:hypothetical protein
MKDGVMKKGKIFSFNETEIHIRSSDGEKDTVLFENRTTDILEHADEVEDLVMAITMIKNKG